MKTHRFDALSFLAGLVMTGIGLAFLLLPEIEDIVSVLTDAGAWFWPLVFVGVGIAVLAPLVSRDPDADEGDNDVEFDG